MPIKNRLDMLATGIKTPVGIKVAGPNLNVIADITTQIEKVIGDVPGTLSVYAERVTGGRFIDVEVNRADAARYGLNIQDVQEIVRTAIGGMNITESVEGLERYPVNLRYPRDVRDSTDRLRMLPIVAPNRAQLSLGQVADIHIEEGPGLIRSENARLNGWIYVDIVERDLGSYVEEARNIVAERISLPPGYSVGWSGQFEYMERAQERLQLILPMTLMIIVLLLYLSFRSFVEVALILLLLPLSLVGAIWLLYLLDFNFSVAAGVGFIALAGVATELGVLMLTYLNQSVKRRVDTRGKDLSIEDIKGAIIEGAVLRVRPIFMTTSTIVLALFPIMLSTGTGSDVMRRIAAPMVGGMTGALLLALFVIPAAYFIVRTARLTVGSRSER
jgi:Cu(I)/Ag(I) efflux system membrane protein CusA/SilA